MSGSVAGGRAFQPADLASRWVDASPTGWDQARQVLETAELFWISTVRADGRPHVTPLVAVWLDEAIYFHTGAEEQKFANLRACPHVVLTTGCNQWDRGLDVVVEGEATPVTDDNLLRRDPQRTARLPRRSTLRRGQIAYRGWYSIAVASMSSWTLTLARPMRADHRTRRLCGRCPSRPRWRSTR